VDDGDDCRFVTVDAVQHNGLSAQGETHPWLLILSVSGNAFRLATVWRSGMGSLCEISIEGYQKSIRVRCKGAYCFSTCRRRAEVMKSNDNDNRGERKNSEGSAWRLSVDVKRRSLRLLRRRLQQPTSQYLLTGTHLQHPRGSNKGDKASKKKKKKAKQVQ